MRFNPREAAAEVARRVARALPEALRSAVLYGSGATEDFRPAHSDVNVAFVFTTLGATELGALRGLRRDLDRARVIRPLLVSERFLQDSLDAFPLEYLLVREHHVLLEGEDRFAGLRIEREMLRLEVERVLRAQEIGLAATYVGGTATPAEARSWAARAGTSIAASSSGLLYLHGDSVPSSRSVLADRVAARFGLDGGAVLSLFGRDRERGGRVAVESILDTAMRVLARLRDAAEELPARPAESTPASGGSLEGGSE